MSSRDRSATAVIGAAYGDEGKGLLVDALATPRTLVVRSNGGAQAGHTVTTPDGRRHVFHHLGSGAFAGARTHLSRFFVAHPMFFAAERAELLAKGATAQVSIDPRASVTTPYDILVNQAVEKSRGDERHGSTGFGFGETVERSLNPGFATPAGELGRADLADVLDRIRREWLPRRLLKLGVKRLDEEDMAALRSDAVLERFLDDVAAFREAADIREDASLGHAGEDILFEGAQGLLLDQDYGAFPHVTRSNTGLVNMAAIAREAGIEEISAIYATRAYTTRHGAGPLAHEVRQLENVAVVDATNAPNDWQGALRLAPLDLDVAAAAMAHDVARARATGLGISHTAAVTCLDQIEGETAVVDRGAWRMASAEDLVGRASEVFGSVAFESWGPSRNTLRPVSRRPSAQGPWRRVVAPRPVPGSSPRSGAAPVAPGPASAPAISAGPSPSG